MAAAEYGTAEWPSHLIRGREHAGRVALFVSESGRMSASIPARLARFASLSNQGTPDAEAARGAGYSATYVRRALSSIVERARDAGLLMDPDAIRAAVADTEDAAARGLVAMTEAVPDAAAHVSAVACGKETPDPARLAYIRELFDRVYGKPKQATDITSGGQPLPWASIREVEVTMPVESDE